MVCKVGSVCRVSVVCGTIELPKYGTRALVAIYGSGKRRAWGLEGLSWSLPTSNFPLLLPPSSPGVGITIYIFNVFSTPRWWHGG